MKFKITLSKRYTHKDVVTCVGWSSTEEVFSAGFVLLLMLLISLLLFWLTNFSDDHQLLCWNVSSNECRKVADLNIDLFPTDLQFLPKIGNSLSKHGDLILLTSADGKFHIMNRTGRVERTVEAHKGAILVGQWGNDGASLLTG